MARRLFGILLAGIVLVGFNVNVYAAEVTHIYELDGNTHDTLGGPEIVLRNPTGLGLRGYTFGEGEGPNLSNAINPSDYSIEMLFQIDATNDWKKLIDFKDRSSSLGLYNNPEGALVFYNIGQQGPDGTLEASAPIHLVVTRNGITAEFTAYVNGVDQFSFTDDGGVAVFSGPENIINFLISQEDSSAENPSGSLDRTRIYQGALTQAQVIDLFRGGRPPGLNARCNERRATIVGTDDDDILTGSAGNDIIAGLGGNDVIYGFGGNDTICGGEGNDVIFGGNGNDQLYGDAGNDVLYGERGDDLLQGGGGNDSLDGGIGRDRLLGEAGNDTLAGGTGNDALNGGPGGDICDGGGDDDTAVTCELRISIP